MSKIEKALKKALGTRETSTGKSLVDIERRSDHNKFVTTNSLTVKKAASTSIANMSEDKALTLEELIERRIIFPGMDDANTANSYRILRTRLLQKSKGENFSLLVTSCTKGDSSSYVALNLSAAFSLDENKTSLVVDCNTKKPRIDKLLGIHSERGITDYIVNQEMNVEDIIQLAGIPRLRVIPAGSALDKSSEYFTTRRMKNLLDGLLERYPDRYVFLDAPSVADSADTKILADLCDFVLIVVPYGKVTKNQVESCIQAIDPQKLLGVVMNDIP